MTAPEDVAETTEIARAKQEPDVLTAKEAWRRMLEASRAWLDARTDENAEAMEAARRDLIAALEVWERRS